MIICFFFKIVGFNHRLFCIFQTMMKAFLEAIPMAGHSPMTECPQQLNHMIHCFIDLWKNKKWQH